MKLPLEVESENQKMVKTEVELQNLLQSIEYTSSCIEEFEELVIETRLKMAELKKLFAIFEEHQVEWEEEGIAVDEVKTLNEKHKIFLQSLQSNFRQSCLNGKKRVMLKEKDLLLKKDVGGESRLRNRKTNKAEAAKKSEDITKNLLDIARLMDTQVKQAEESNVILQTSSEQVADTHEEYKGLTGIISVSRKLLSKYNRRELTDTLLIFFGLVLFFATVIYIISKRI